MKDPKHTKAKGSSFNGQMKSITLNGVGFGGMRDVIVRFAMIIMKRMMNPEILIAHGNPTSTIRRWT